jgi:hypothetical protein
MNMGRAENAKCDFAGFVVTILCDGDSDAVAELMDRACGYNESYPATATTYGHHIRAWSDHSDFAHNGSGWSDGGDNQPRSYGQ